MSEGDVDERISRFICGFLLFRFRDLRLKKQKSRFIKGEPLSCLTAFSLIA